MIIEQLKLQDLNDLKDLYENGFEGTATDMDQLVKTFEKISNSPDYHVLVAKENGKVVGSVMGIICNELFGRCLPFMVVENVVVLNDYRRQGIAKKLMIRIEEIAIQGKCTTILFVSSAHRTGAHKLYESLGYGIDKVNGYRKRLIK